MKLYPLQFEPILKKESGRRKLKTLLNKPITSTITGESWELSTVEGDVCCCKRSMERQIIDCYY
jgi:mannose-6-phosphate isomerase